MKNKIFSDFVVFIYLEIFSHLLMPTPNFPNIQMLMYTVPRSISQSIHWHVQNAVISCRSQEPLPFLPVIHFFLPLLSANHSSILPHFILPSSLTSSSHLFLGLPLGLVVSRFIYNTLLGILFSSILCTCQNQLNLCSLIVSVIVGLFNICINFFIS